MWSRSLARASSPAGWPGGKCTCGSPQRSRVHCTNRSSNLVQVNRLVRPRFSKLCLVQVFLLRDEGPASPSRYLLREIAVDPFVNKLIPSYFGPVVLPGFEVTQDSTSRTGCANRLRSAVLLLLLALCSSAILQALDPGRHIDQYGHDVWTSQHGLPGQAVYQILQSPDGYLWLRTSAGLVRFDGVRFVSMDAAVGSEPVESHRERRGRQLAAEDHFQDCALQGWGLFRLPPSGATSRWRNSGDL